MRVEWKHISDHGRNLMQAWLVCDVEGRELPVMAHYLGTIAADDKGDVRAELTFWGRTRNALYPTHLLQPEINDGALTFSGRPYKPGEHDEIEREIAQTIPMPANWETAQSWVDQTTELAKWHTDYLPIKRLS